MLERYNTPDLRGDAKSKDRRGPIDRRWQHLLNIQVERSTEDGSDVRCSQVHISVWQPVNDVVAS